MGRTRTLGRFWRERDYALDPGAQRVFSGMLILNGMVAALTLVHGLPRTLWAFVGVPLFGCGVWLTFRIRNARHDGQTLAYGFGALACIVAGGVLIRLVGG